MEKKRIKVSGGGQWFNSTVTCDGEPLDVEALSIQIGTDDLTQVTLTFAANHVEFDLHSPPEVEWTTKPETREAAS